MAVQNIFATTTAGRVPASRLDENFDYLLDITNTSTANAVADLAALKALTTRPEAVIVETGQAKGVWQWELGSSTTADDALVVTPTSGTAGRYKRVYDGPLNVTWWGTAGDGSTDDAVPLQAAITASTTLGRALYVPQATYITGTKLTSVTGLELFGDGWDSIIKMKNSSNIAAILEVGGEASQSSGEIRDICFDGNLANNTAGVGLNIIRGYKFNLFNVRVTLCSSHGIQYSGTATSFENYIRQCNSYANEGFGVYMIGAVTDTHVDSCDIGFNTLGGIRPSTSCTMRDNTVWGGGLATSVGIQTAGSNTRIFNNIVEGHGLHGIQIAAGNHYARIKGNTIYAVSYSSGTTGSYDGIHIEAATNGCMIEANSVYAAIDASGYSPRYALNFAGAHETSVVAGNDFTWLVAGATLAQRTAGAVCSGVLETDKCDFNWIRTRVRARRSASLTTLTVGAWTALPFNTEDVDTLTEFSNGVFTPKDTGLYEIESRVLYTPQAADQDLGLSFYTNAGVEVRRLGFTQSQNTSFHQIGGVAVEYLTGGTAYDLRYWVENTATVIEATGAITYCKIRAVPL
jgi:hypothetical protein